MIISLRISQSHVGRRVDRRHRRGFTLVEMLVAVALVLLMMVLFAEVFQIAGSSIAKTRGLAENDQRSRTLQTIIKADLDKRTFRWVFPFAANENPGAPGSNIGKRQGFFYISENNPYNALDDVLHFTVMTTITIRNTDDSPYYGQALNLASFTYPNQPDADDGQLVPNNTGLSTVAEIAYFVRNGNLYRRQLLIREPLAIAGTMVQPNDGTQQNPNGANVFGPNLVVGPPPVPAFRYSPTGPFWNDFDYSAYFTFSGAMFLGSDSLDNSGSAIRAIANPAKRFGFSPAGVGVIPGCPKEFRADTVAGIPTADLTDFIGRFTLQECSDPNFRYPQNVTSSGDIPTNPAVPLARDPDGRTVGGFVNGSRRGEDLLLTNVHAFDIQVWDELGQSFVNVGDTSLASASYDYALGNRYAAGEGLGTPPSPAYGPRLTENTAIYATNAVFDTWHPQINLNTANDPATSPDPTTGQTAFDEPPFRPLYRRPLAVSAAGDTPSWRPDTPYAVGNVVFPSGPPTVAQPSPPFILGSKGQLPSGFPFYYRCTGTIGNSHSNVSEPGWSQLDGLTVIDNNVIWQAVDNRKPLKAIKLQIRFVDTSTQQMRQLTIIHSLVD